MSISPEVQQRLVILRQKAVEGTATLEDYKEAVVLMRGDRKAGGSAPAAGKKGSSAGKPKAVIPSADDMLDELK